MPIAKLVMSEEEQGLLSQEVKVKRKELRINSISPLSPHTSPTPHTQKASYIRALRLT